MLPIYLPEPQNLKNSLRNTQNPFRAFVFRCGSHRAERGGWLQSSNERRARRNERKTTPFSAKQTQSSKRPDEIKFIYNKNLREDRHLVDWEKQSQFKANCRNAKMLLNPYITMYYANKPRFRSPAKQTQFKPKKANLAVILYQLL